MTFAGLVSGQVGSLGDAGQAGLRERARSRLLRLFATIGPRHGDAHVAGGARPTTTTTAPDRVVAVPAGPVLVQADPALLVRFLYESLDAHHDTARLVDEQVGEDMWRSHLDYLRALQRNGRALLALADDPKLGPTG